jgi:hypothetical protein
MGRRDIVTKGNNYGWNIKEGYHCFDPKNPNHSPAQCQNIGPRGEPLVDPIIEYGHPANGGPGIANIGGYVYRGGAINALAGDYIFADWSTSFTKGDGTVFSAAKKDGKWTFSELGISNFKNNRLGLFIKGVGQDADNELYLLTTQLPGPLGSTGKIYKIVSP